MGRERTVIRTKKAGILTKIVVFSLLTFLSVRLLDIQSQIKEMYSEVENIQDEVAETRQRVDNLEEAIANPDDPERIESIARDKLGYVKPGEKVFIEITE